VALQFDLHQLGWYAFEQLCRTIARAVWNQPVESYSRGPDGGRDGALFGPWTQDEASAPVLLQSKHSGAPVTHLSVADVQQEFAKAQSHVEAGRCDRYILMTNARVSAGVAAEIEAGFRAVGVRVASVLGYEAICELLEENKRLRAQVPRLYGLGDLTEILDERAYAQAEAVLAVMHDDLARLVPVDAHRRAHEALAEHRFALLLGRAGSGKTSIAASLAIGAIDLYEARPITLNRITELTDRWNPNARDQLFWLDDAFGATQFDHPRADEWNRMFPTIRAALKGGARLIATSRDYVFAAARPNLKVGVLPALEEGRVVIEVEAFTAEERQQILFNHLRLGRQPKSFLEELTPSDLEAVAEHPEFLPELARRLGDPLFTRRVVPGSRDSLVQFVARPQQFLLELIASLDVPSRAALGLVHLRGASLPSPVSLEPGDEDFLRRVGVSEHEAVRALETLNGSFLRLAVSANDRWWAFHHPSFMDAYRAWLGERPELLREYVTSTPVQELIASVTCGEVGVEGAIVLPSSLFDLVIDRLKPVQPMDRRYFGRWLGDAELSFLTHRTSTEFLLLYLERDADVLAAAFDIDTPLENHTAERDLARRLLDEGLADQEHRTVVATNLVKWAATAEDASFLDDDRWISWLTTDELAELDRRVRSETMGRLQELVEAELRRWSPSSPELVEPSLDAYAARYPEFAEQISAVQEAVREAASEPGEDDNWVRNAQRTSSTDEPGDRRRSIFDDLVS
jgi:hypothetical protein